MPDHPHDPRLEGPFANVMGGQEETPRNYGLRPYSTMPDSIMLPGSLNPPAPRSAIATQYEADRIGNEMLTSVDRINTYLLRAADRLESRGQRGGIVTSVPGRIAPDADPVMQARHLERRSGRSPYEEAPTSHGEVDRTTTEMLEGTAADGEVPVQERRWRTNPRHYSLRSLRQDAAEWAGRGLSEWHVGPRLHADAVTGRMVTTEGVDASASEIASFARGQKITGAVTNLLTGIGGGEGPMAALQGALPGVAGAIAAPLAAYAVARQVRDFAQGQRNANAGWQRALGGSNAEGFEERSRSQMFEIGQSWFGGMGAGQAEKLYQGAAEIYGTDRQARGVAQDFGIREWRKLGIEVATSLELVKASAESGNESLANLANSLEGVTKAARDAHMNADEVRRVFSGNLAATSQVMGGASAPVTAAGLTAAKTALGHQFPGVEYGSLLTQQSITQQASLLGMTRTQYLNQSETNPQLFGQGATLQLQRVAAMVLGPQTADYVRQRLQAGAAWDDIADEVERRTGIDVFAAAQSVNALVPGIGVTPENVTLFLIKQFVQETSPAGIISDAVAATTPKKVSGASGARDLAKSLGVDDLLRGLQSAPGGKDAIKDYLKSGDIKDLYDAGPIVSSASKSDQTRLGYVLSAQASGTTAPIVEQLLKNSAYSGYKWRVKTADGERVVDTQTLATLYGDQAQAGTVTVAGGSDADQGKNIASLLGVQPSSGMATPSASAPAGKGAKEDKAGETGTITIVPSPLLRDLLYFIPSGNARVDPQYAGTPGTPFYPPGTQTPTG